MWYGRLLAASALAVTACGSAMEVPPAAGSDSDGSTTSTSDATVSTSSASGPTTMDSATSPSTSSSTTSLATTDSTTAATDSGTTDPTTDSTGGGSTGSPPAGCSNGRLDGDETDVDCGGSCTGCDFGRACGGNDDCANSSCSGQSTCALQQPRVWLDGRDASSLYRNNGCTQNNPAIGQAVECWRNKGTAGGNFTELNGNTGVYDGGGGINLTGDTYFRTGIFNGMPADVTVFVVLQETNVGNAYAFNLNYPNDGNDDRYAAQVPDTDQMRRITWEPGGDQNRVESGANAFVFGTPHITVLQNTAYEDRRAIFLDGVEVGQQAGAAMAPASGVSIGNGGNMAFRELRVYTGPFLTLARQEVEGDLACRWNLRNLLPNGHPYYSADGFSDIGCP